MSDNRLLLLAILLGVVLIGAGIGIGYGIGVAVFQTKCDEPETNHPTMEPIVDKLTSTAEPICENKCGKKKMKDVPYCPKINPVVSQKKGIFDALTGDEMEKVRTAMMQENIITNQTGLPELRHNYIFAMILLTPAKNEALAHLDRNVSLPERFAEVHVHRGGVSPPDVMEYKVGPLTSEQMVITPLTSPGQLHYNSRPRDWTENNAIHEALAKELVKLKQLMVESFDGAYFPGGGLDWFPLAPPGLKPEERETKIQMSLEVAGTIHGAKLHTMPLVATLHNPGIDTSKWYVHDLFYLNQGPYKNCDSLLNAYRQGSIRKVTLPEGYRDTLVNLTIPIQTSPTDRKYADKAPPRTFEPAGPRYEMYGNTVHWMGWELIVTSNMLRGPSIYNIKFKDERIVYENSLSESSLIYAGDSAYDGNAVYLDATFALGMFDDLIIGKNFNLCFVNIAQIRF